MNKKFFALVLSFMLMMTSMTPALAAGDSGMVAAEKLDAVEMTLYGTAQSGSMVERIDVLENDVYGAPTTDGILDRVANVYNYICGDSSKNGDESSFVIRLNAVDSRFNKQLTTGPAKTRIEKLEETIFGATNTGSLNARLSKLVTTAYETDSVPCEKVVLPKDSLVKIEFTKELSSKVAKAGDPIHFIVGDNVYVNDVLVIAKGAAGVGTIKKVVQPRSFGRDARIDLNFSHVYGIDGSTIQVYIGELAKQEAKTAAGAAGATIGGMIILGPIGAIGGAFVTGQSMVIPAGSSTFVQITNDATINGVVYQPVGSQN